MATPEQIAAAESEPEYRGLTAGQIGEALDAAAEREAASAQAAAQPQRDFEMVPTPRGAERVAVTPPAQSAQGPAANAGNVTVLPPQQQQPQGPQPGQPGVAVGYAPVTLGGTSSSSTSGIDAASQKRLGEAYKGMADAEAAGIEAARPQIERNAQAASEQAALAQERARLQSDYANRAAQQSEQTAVAAERKRKEVDALADDFMRSGDKIDPNRVWHRMDTGQKVGFTISAALAGIGQALMTGYSQGRIAMGSNPVIDMLERAQERDLHAQELAINVKGRGVQMKESMYSRLIEAGVAKDVALSKVQLAQDQAIVDQIAAAQAKAQTSTAAEQMAALQAQWQKVQAQHQIEYTQAIARHVSSSSSLTRQLMPVDAQGNPVVGPKAGSKEAEAAATVAAIEAIPGVKLKNRALLQHVEENRGLMTKVQEQLQGVQQIHVALKGMGDLSKRYGTTYGVTEEGASAQSQFELYKKAFAAGIRNAYGENATDATNAALEKLANVSLSDWRQGVTRAKLDGMAKAAGNEVNARYAPLGLAFDPRAWESAQPGAGVVRQVQVNQ